MNSRRQTFFLLSNGTSSRSFPHVGQRACYIDIPADLAALWASHCTSSMRKEDEMVWGVGSSLWAWISLRSKLIFRRLNSRSGWASVPHTVFDGSHVAGDTIWSYPPSKVFLLPTHIFFFFFFNLRFPWWNRIPARAPLWYTQQRHLLYQAVIVFNLMSPKYFYWWIFQVHTEHSFGLLPESHTERDYYSCEQFKGKIQVWASYS